MIVGSPGVNRVFVSGHHERRPVKQNRSALIDNDTFTNDLIMILIIVAPLCVPSAVWMTGKRIARWSGPNVFVVSGFVSLKYQ